MVSAIAKKKLKTDGILFCGENANDVTGSCTYIRFAGKQILLECGLYQDNSYLESYKINSKKFKFNPKEIDYVFVEHVHIDHIGLLPRLVSEGFTGRIIMTKASAVIAKHLLLNCAFILEDEARVLSKRYGREYKPIYTEEDVYNTLPLFKIYDEYNSVKELDSLNNELSGMASSAERIKFGNQMQNWISQNTKATKEAKAEIQDYINRVKDVNTEMSKGDFNSVKNGYKSIVSEMTAAGKIGKSFSQELGRGFKQIGEFAYTYGAIQQLETWITGAVGELKEVDSILTEISKTSNLTNTQLKQLGSDAFDQASVYGKKASDYLLGIQEMSRSGYYGKNAENMANLSVLAQAAGDLTADTANSYLLASNAAYNYQGNVEKLNAVLDGQNEINKMVSLYGNI